ncbi:MAG: pantoate--beta-alanine ligase [Verrucomicrobiaceae bacterium]|jgi:pantoate--beta-alanine ligase|nr:pantoate--beta-alanine ligase [Verrucomicrobiaceae bacterium]
MKVVITTSELQPLLAEKCSPKKRVLVATMGSLHEGHLALIHRARQIAGTEGVVILSLFVNPTQFDQADDLRHYPRALEQDLALCKKHGVDIVFAPESGDIYHSDHSVTVTESSLSQRLCGASRPGHFDGVCTVVLKLFNLTQPDIAIFGKKDYQQLAIIRRMVRDLNIPISIEGVETVREQSGLALSSRNQRLSQHQRSDAQRIRRALLAAQTAHQQGEKSAQSLLNIVSDIIESSELDVEIDYLELLDQDDLQPVETLSSPAIIATAVFYEQVRLIDNIELA